MTLSNSLGKLTSLENNDDCAAAFPVDDDGSIPEEEDDAKFPKVMEWRQCDGSSTLSGIEFVEDENGDPTSSPTSIDCSNDDNDNDLDDQSWENPYDVAKGHRGFPGR